jgi:hypothetical protein
MTQGAGEIIQLFPIISRSAPSPYLVRNERVPFAPSKKDFLLSLF